MSVTAIKTDSLIHAPTTTPDEKRVTLPVRVCPPVAVLVDSREVGRRISVARPHTERLPGRAKIGCCWKRSYATVRDGGSMMTYCIV